MSGGGHMADESEPGWRERQSRLATMEAERDKYRKALEEICRRGRCPIAEKALGI